ncbi:MAG: amidohydrolase family protein [Deltaproteobacteria bacterium]|nr:amidohydrolase family protein [Deltaproteobacteria bacterium]
MSKRVIRGATVMALDGRRTLRQTDVLIDGNRIAAVGGVDAGDALVTHARGVLIPSFVQAHVRSEFALTDRYFVPDVNPWVFQRYQLEAWHQALDEDARYVQARAAYSRGVHAGAGTFGDFVGPGIEPAVRAAQEFGVRVTVFVGSQNEMPEALLDRVMAVAETRQCGALVSAGLFGGHAERVSKKMLRRSVRLAATRRVPLAFYVGLFPDDRGGIARLEREGALGPSCLLCYGRTSLFASERHRNVLAETGVSVVLSPSADVLTHAPTPSVGRLLAEGINVAIGSDTGASRIGYDPFKELRLLMPHLRASVEAPASRALEVGAVGGARALNLDGGTIQVGRRADLMLLDIEPQPNEDHEHLAARIIESAGPDTVRAMWIDGEVVILDGRFAKGNPPTEASEAAVRARLCHALDARMQRLSRIRRGVLNLRLRRSAPR